VARVLDLAGLAGVYATRLLAEEGHDVIRVEPPAGDEVRRLGPYLGETPDLEGGSYHQFFNAGKRSLTLNLGDDRDEVASFDAWAVFERLVATADVIVASTPLPLGDAEIRHLNPNVVLTIVGNDELPELCMYARTGLLAITGHPGATPVLMGGHIIYAATGLWVMVGTAAAMLVQRTTGQGQTVNVDVQDCFETFLDHAVENFTARGRPTERRGHRGAVTPISGAFPCADGYWMLSLSDSTERWRRLVEWMADDDLKDESLLEYDARLAQRDMILDRIGAWAMAFKKQDVVTEAQRRHFPSAPVCTPLDLTEDPQLIDRGFLVEMNQPELGPMRYPRGAIANLWGHDVRPAPKLGEHNAEILTELGFGPEEQLLLFERSVT
jgi:crotonobetainyl-CoA:carnitine CoA-transferase CaiB-like acyl-CoA transferase